MEETLGIARVQSYMEGIYRFLNGEGEGRMDEVGRVYSHITLNNCEL